MKPIKMYVITRQSDEIMTAQGNKKDSKMDNLY